MKKLLLVCLWSGASLCTKAQLENTVWKGTVKGDNPRNVFLHFTKDSATVYTIADNEQVEVMTYTLKGSTFTVHKIEGQSDCDNTTPGTYHFSIQNDKMLINLVSDRCTDRSSALDTTRWFRWKKHVEVKLSPAVLQQYVGVYQFNPEHLLYVTLDKGVLFIEGPNNNLPKTPLMPEGNNRFLIKIAAVDLDFVKDGSGKVVKFISHEEQDHDVIKIK